MTGRLRVPRRLAERLRMRGIALPEVLQRAGLPAAFFRQDRISATTAEFFALWRAIAAASGDPAIGLDLGEESRLEHYGPTAIAAVCSRTFRDALQRIGRYKRLTCPEEVRIRASRAEVAVEFVFTEASEEEPEVLVDLCLAWLLAIGRRGTDGQIVPRRVELTRRAAHAAMYEERFGCRIQFRARRNALVFDPRDMDRPFITHNEDLLAAIGAQLDLELDAARSDRDVGELVKRTLRRSLAGRRPALRDVARELGLGERTLQRRLTEAGKPFQRLAEEARRELARHYLGNAATEYHEVAYLLGYGDANSFFRAFRRWEGATPGEWRQRHADPAAAPARRPPPPSTDAGHGQR